MANNNNDPHRRVKSKQSSAQKEWHRKRILSNPSGGKRRIKTVFDVDFLLRDAFQNPRSRNPNR